MSSPQQMPQIRYPTTPPTSALNNGNNSEYTPLPANFNPGPNDIVCGRGRGYYNCQGNVQFRATVKQFVEYYLKQPNKSSKTAVLEEIVQYCKRHDQAKFVKQLQGAWQELSDLSAREKVGNAMREAISARNVQLQQQQAHQQAFAQQQALLTQQQQHQQSQQSQQQQQQRLERRQQPAWQRTTVRQEQQSVPLLHEGNHPAMPAPQPMADSTLSTGSATASGRHEIFGKKIAFLSDSQVQYDGGRQNSLFMKTSGTTGAPALMNMSLSSSMPRRHSGSHAQTVQHAVQQQQQRPPLRRSSSERSSLAMSHSIAGGIKSSGLSSFNQSVVMNFDSLTLPQGGSSEFILTGSLNSGALSSSNATDSILSVMTTDSSTNNNLTTATV